MYTLEYKSEAGSIVFSVTSGFVIEEFDSPYAIGVDFTTSTGSKSYGVKVENQRVQPKTITISGTIIGYAKNKRQDLVHVIAPMQEGTLVFNGQHSMHVYPKSSPTVERFDYNPRFSFMLYVPMPYWQSVEERTASTNDHNAAFSFPWDWGSTFRFSKISGETFDATNSGDAPCTWTLEVEASGEVVNPMLTKTETGEFVRVNITLTEGQKLIVTTDQDEMQVMLVDADGRKTDAFSYLDVDSTSFYLDVGENPMAFAPMENALATVHYFENFAGV